MPKKDEEIYTHIQREKKTNKLQVIMPFRFQTNISFIYGMNWFFLVNLCVCVCVYADEMVSRMALRICCNQTFKMDKKKFRSERERKRAREG